MNEQNRPLYPADQAASPELSAEQATQLLSQAVDVLFSSAGALVRRDDEAETLGLAWRYPDSELLPSEITRAPDTDGRIIYQLDYKGDHGQLLRWDSAPESVVRSVHYGMPPTEDGFEYLGAERIAALAKSIADPDEHILYNPHKKMVVRGHTGDRLAGRNVVGQLGRAASALLKYMRANDEPTTY